MHHPHRDMPRHKSLWAQVADWISQRSITLNAFDLLVLGFLGLLCLQNPSLLGREVQVVVTTLLYPFRTIADICQDYPGVAAGIFLALVTWKVTFQIPCLVEIGMWVLSWTLLYPLTYLDEVGACLWLVLGCFVMLYTIPLTTMRC